MSVSRSSGSFVRQEAVFVALESEVLRSEKYFEMRPNFWEDFYEKASKANIQCAISFSA